MGLQVSGVNGLGGGICDLLKNMSADGLRALDSAFFASDPANTGCAALLPQPQNPAEAEPVVFLAKNPLGQS